MVLTSTKQFCLSLLFAVQNKLHLLLLTYHCQILSCLNCRWIFGCRASPRSAVTHRAAAGPQNAAGLGVSLGWCCRMPSATSAGSCGATAPSSATAPGCVCSSTHRDSQRSHGRSFTPQIKRFQGCLIHKDTFLFKVMNSLTKCVYKLLPNIQHISNIKDSSREFSNKKITSSATIFRRNYLQTKFLRTLEYSHWKVSLKIKCTLPLP